MTEDRSAKNDKVVSPTGDGEFPRRFVLRTGATIGVGAVAASALAACSDKKKSFGGSDDDRKTGAATSSKAGGGGAAGGGGDQGPKGNGTGVSPTPRNQTVIIDQNEMTVFDRFNPFIPNGENYQGGLGQVCKEYLWYQNLATGETLPWLGKSYTYANGNKQITLNLNTAAKWNDGTPFTSADVKFTIELLQKNQSLLGGTYTQEVSKVTAPNPGTVVIDLKAANPRYHYNFICGIVSANMLVMPKHIWEGKDPTKFANNPPVYTGPYKFSRAIPDHKMFVWEKVDAYWNKAKLDSKPKYVVYRSAPAADTDIQQFKDAQIDLAGAPNVYQLVKNLVDGGYKNATITPMVDPCERAILMNCDPARGPLGDPKIRQAVSALIDRKKIGTTIWPVDVPVAVYPWPNYPNNTKWEVSSVAAKYPLTYDTKKAEQLLDAAGAKKGSDGKRSYKGKKMSFQIITPVTTSDPEYFIAQLLATALKKVGIDASAKTLASSVYTDQRTKGEYDMRSEWLCGELLDPQQLYTNFRASLITTPIGKTTPGSNDVRLKWPALDNATAKLTALPPTATSAKPIFTEALDQWYQAMPAVPSVQTTYTHLFNTTYWTGWPTADDLYQVPNNWWGQFMFVVGSLKATGK
jgi:peptide/nickel transport system substrate-binding protein